jgi:endo-1,4-beta-xylanase
MKIFLPVIFHLIILQLLLFCSLPAKAQVNNAVQGKGLKEYYKDFFSIGVAVSPRALKTDEAQLILSQFNSMTAENAMKMGPIHPQEHKYNWEGADSIAAFAKRNNLKLRGHTLCWHNQTPPWLFIDSATGKQVTKEVLLQRLKDHITSVVARYKGIISSWDVVNEAISDQKDEYLRNSLWYQVCGEEYIAKAFQWAHEADPDALLFYNDYNEIDPVKREKIIRTSQKIKYPRANKIRKAHNSIKELGGFFLTAGPLRKSAKPE